MLPAILLAAPASTLVPTALRCESLTDPLGIGRTNPHFSWKLEASRPGLKNLRQSAYRVVVASSPTLLASGKGDLWDTGRVASSNQFGIEMPGKRLKSGAEAWWGIQVWDARGAVSGWSKPAHFSVGLLSEKDWSAKWIAYDPARLTADQQGKFGGAKWIWSTKDQRNNVPVVTREFSKSFDLKKAGAPATFSVTADDQFDLYVNDVRVGGSDGNEDAWKRFVTVDVTKTLRVGTNTVRIVAKNTGIGEAGAIGRLTVNGESVLVTDSSWTDGDEKVRVVGNYGVAPWGKFAEGRIFFPATHYAHDFTAAKRLKKATAHVTALGLVDFYVNGTRVTNDLFTPGWTDYNKRVHARTFDVTKMIREGGNSVAAEVGDGWYSGYVGYGAQRNWYGERPRLRAQITLEYADGHRETIGTSKNWKAGESATRLQDFLAGEEYDARLASSASHPVGKATEVRNLKANIEPFPGVPVRPYQWLKPIGIKKSKNGYMLDYGQNLAGFVHLRAKGAVSHTIEMHFLEALNPDGTPYTANLRGARAVDKYTFASNSVENWEPRFTFHGFRYMEVVGLGRMPTKDEFTAVAISSATPETGKIETSSPLINKLAKNAWWTQKMNFIDVPTDCPQRDERLGWMGDAQAYIRTAATYSDVQTFFDKWMVSVDDDQRKDGQFPMVAPQIVAGDDGGPAWADAGVICPWTIYDVYGDKRQLARHYPAMKKFVEFCRKRSTSDLLPPRQYHAFGDWLSINANTPNDVIYEAYFAGSARLLAQSARVLGNREDAEKYEALYRDIKAAFNRAYVSPDGIVRGDTQTGYVLALGFDLLDGQVKTFAAARLVANIQSRKWHLSTGFVGTRDLMQVLSKIGRNDVAFRLLHNTTFPSWGFEIVNGATTVWERWDGWTPEKGFQDPGMNSFAHYAYGAVMGWVFATVGGIDNATPGFSVIKIAPQIDPNMTWAKTSYESIRGPIKTEWRKVGRKLTLSVEVPPNTTAIITIPGGGVKTVGSGSYKFVSTL